MSFIESKLKKENENYKKLFDFNGNETQLKHLKEFFINYIKNSKNDSIYFIKLLNFYAKCRPHLHSASRELVECVHSCFLEQIDEIQQKIKKQKILKFSNSKIIKLPNSQIHHISRRISNS